MTSLRFRAAGPDDAEKVGMLHADSWRRHYRGAYADSFLDGDVVADRWTVWSSRLADPADSMTVVAEDDTGLVGFVHVVFDADRPFAERPTSKYMYLWVLAQNTVAQQFYRAHGGTCVETALVSPPGGVPARLNGAPNKLRFAWPDASLLARNTIH
jgi:hypothetical protein